MAACVGEVLESRLLLSVSILQYHNDASGTGQNLSETILNQSNVNSTSFGKQFSTSVDGQVYAEPLYDSGVDITTGAYQGIHNVVFVATENDSLYAMDATTGTVLWQDSFLGTNVVAVPSANVDSSDITPTIGITSTPVIDPANNVLYLTAKTMETRSDGTHYVYRLHAINISNGTEALGGPAVIADTLSNTYPDPSEGVYDTFISGPSVDGTGDGSVNGVITFDARIQMQRPAVTLVNETIGGVSTPVIFLGFASHGDQGPYHGWLLAYNALNLSLVGVFNTAPNAQSGVSSDNPPYVDQSGIWQSGGQITSDSSGNVYVMTGNGAFDTTLNASGFPANGNYGDSFIKIAIDPNSSPTNQNGNGWGLKVVDYFTPFNQATLNVNDGDVGDTAPMLLPASVGSSTHEDLLVGGTKAGTIYLLDTNNMGKFNATANNDVQEITLANKIYGNLSYYDGMIYVGYTNGSELAYSISNAHINTTPVSTPDTYPYPNPTTTISANGSNTGTSVAWEIEYSTTAGQLRAYDANNLSDEIYTSAQASGGRDSPGATIKFTVPTVANGMVYVGAAAALVGYGLFSQSPTLKPPIVTASATSPTDVYVSWVPNSMTTATGYEIERSPTGAGGSYTDLDTVGSSVLSYNDTTVTENETFYYTVSALNGSDSSRQSAAAPVTTPLNTPTGLAANLISSSGTLEVALTWTDTSLMDTSEEIDRNSGSGYQFLKSVPAGTGSYTDGTAAVGSTDTYRVEALNSSNSSAYDISNGVTVAQVLTSVAVTPATLTLAVGSSYQFAASALDQFGNPIAGQTFTWGVTGANNSINASGLLKLSNPQNRAQVSATDGSVVGNAIVTPKAASTPAPVTVTPVQTPSPPASGGTSGGSSVVTVPATPVAAPTDPTTTVTPTTVMMPILTALPTTTPVVTSAGTNSGTTTGTGNVTTSGPAVVVTPPQDPTSSDPVSTDPVTSGPLPSLNAKLHGHGMHGLITVEWEGIAWGW
jgi:hypothetical protein